MKKAGILGEKLNRVKLACLACNLHNPALTIEPTVVANAKLVILAQASSLDSNLSRQPNNLDAIASQFEKLLRLHKTHGFFWRKPKQE